jgi:hypothetical protein
MTAGIVMVHLLASPAAEVADATIAARYGMNGMLARVFGAEPVGPGFFSIVPSVGLYGAIAGGGGAYGYIRPDTPP